MNIERIHDIDLDLIKESVYDVGIFASGYEKRCTFISENAGIRPSVTVPIILGFEELSNGIERRRHDEILGDVWKRTPKTFRANDDQGIYRELTSIVPEDAERVRILVDYSSMSRIWYAALLNWARFASSVKEIVVDFLYSIGDYVTTGPPKIIADMVSVPGCEGVLSLGNKYVVVFGLGFHGFAAQSVLDRLEADDVFAFYATSNETDDVPRRVINANKDLIDDPKARKPVIGAPLRSVETTVRILSELVTPYRKRDNVTLVPMGPKPHILSCMLVSMRFREVSSMRVSVERFKPEEVSATGEVISTRVVLTSPSLKDKVSKSMIMRNS